MADDGNEDNPPLGNIFTLFAAAKTSMTRFVQDNERLEKERRQRKKKQQDDVAPLFATALSPQWNVEAKPFDVPSSSASAKGFKRVSTSDTEPLYEQLKKCTEEDTTREDSPPPPSYKSREVMASDILKKLKQHINSSSSADAVSSSSSTQLQPLQPSPSLPPSSDTLPESERRRRAEAEASIRQKAAELKEQIMKPPVKPLVFKRPSFQYPPKDQGKEASNEEEDDREMPAVDKASGKPSSAAASSSKHSGKKRKAPPPPQVYDTVNLYYHRPANSGAAMYTTNASALPSAVNSRRRRVNTHQLNPSSGISGLVSYETYSLPPFGTTRQDYTAEEINGLIQTVDNYNKSQNESNKRRKSEDP